MRCTVIGAGNGGIAISALLKHYGHFVTLYTHNTETVTGFGKCNNVIQTTGAAKCSEKIDVITTEIAVAIKQAEYIFIVTPAFLHKNVAREIAPYLSKEQIIILNPGRTAGVVSFICNLKEFGFSDENIPAVCETESLFCAARKTDTNKVHILSFKKECPISGIPYSGVLKVSDAFGDVYRGIAPRISTLDTGLNNIGAMLHPAPVLLNAGWIETRDVFFGHYYHGISPTVAKFLEKMDMERVAIAKALGASVKSLKQWHEDNYGVVKDNLYDTLQANSTYASLDAPRTLQTRYIFEDVPTGLVPMSTLAKFLKIETPCMDLIIKLACMLMDTDFVSTGRNFADMLNENMSFEQIKDIFAEQIR